MKSLMSKLNPFNFQIGGNHYKKKDDMMDCPDVTEFCMRRNVPSAEFNVIKYTYRHASKNGFQDILKAFHYLLFIAWLRYDMTIKDVLAHFGLELKKIEPPCAVPMPGPPIGSWSVYSNLQESKNPEKINFPKMTEKPVNKGFTPMV